MFASQIPEHISVLFIKKTEVGRSIMAHRIPKVIEPWADTECIRS